MHKNWCSVFILNCVTVCVSVPVYHLSGLKWIKLTAEQENLRPNEPNGMLKQALKQLQ